MVFYIIVDLISSIRVVRREEQRGEHVSVAPGEDVLERDLPGEDVLEKDLLEERNGRRGE